MLGEHIKEEEKDDLPMLEKELSEQESNDAASSFDMRKKIVPTRSVDVLSFLTAAILLTPVCTGATLRPQTGHQWRRLLDYLRVRWTRSEISSASFLRSSKGCGRYSL